MDSLREHRDFPDPGGAIPSTGTARSTRSWSELAQLGALAAASSWPDDYLARNLAEIARFVEETTRLEASAAAITTGSRPSSAVSHGARSWSWKGAKRTTFGALSRDEVLARRDQAKAKLDAFIAASDADLAPLLHDALQAPIARLRDS